MIKEQFQFDWKSFREHAATAFSSSLGDQALADVTLVADGSVALSAHKFVLGSASPVLKKFFASNPSIHSPCLFMFGLSTDILNSILEFIYKGETVVSYENLDSFMMAATNLQLSLNKLPEQFTSDGKDLVKEHNITPSQLQKLSTIHKEKEIVSMRNTWASKDKTVFSDIKTETIQKKERLGTKWQGPNIGQLKSQQTLASSEETSEIKIQRVTQENKFNESFQCQLCSKTFEYKTTLRNHTLIKHS